MKQEMYYTAYGLQIESQLALPELLPSTVRTTDVAIRYGAVPSSLDNPTGQGIVYQAKPGQLLLTLDGIANYLVSDGTEITIARAPGSRDDDVRLFLLGSAFGALLHQRSVLPLHGSAVATPHGAAVFVGHSGYGKSTLAAALGLSRGVRADDARVPRLAVGPGGDARQRAHNRAPHKR